MKEEKKENTTELVDLYRDTPVRYLGYANEVGESFRAFVHVGVVRLSYALASAYVCADAASKGINAYQSFKKNKEILLESNHKEHSEKMKTSSLLKENVLKIDYKINPKSVSREVGVVVIDTLLWQTFASVIIPGFTINRICHLNQKLLERLTRLPLGRRKVMVTLVGLLCIPFIIHPIDHLVTVTMNQSFRRVYNK